MYIKLILIMVAFISSSYAGYYDEAPGGYYFYQDLLQKKKNVKVNSRPSRAVIAKQKKAIQEELEYRKALATLYPTDENVTYLREYQAKILKQASILSDRWMYVTAMNPKLDETIENPISQSAAMVKKEEKSQYESKLIKSLAKDYGLFFFYHSKCPHCHKMASIVDRFAKTHGLALVGMSIDGVHLNLPHNETDNAVVLSKAREWGITQVPTIVIYDVKKNIHLAPIVGHRTEDILKSRLVTIMTGGKNG